MALSGIQIYKLLPQTNCKDCGFPTCLAFAMKLAAKQVELSACPHVSEDSKSKLAESSEPPVRLVTLKSDGYELKVGNEVVLYRHEKTFYHKPGFFLKVTDSTPLAEIKETVAAVDAYKVNYVGMDLSLDGFAVECTSGVAEIFKSAIGAVRSASKKPLILIAKDIAIHSAGLESLKGESPLVHAADGSNWEAMTELAMKSSAVLVVKGNSLDEIAVLTQKIKDKGFNDLVLDPGSLSLHSNLASSTQIRKLALKKNLRSLGYSIINFPGAVGDSYMEPINAIQAITKYAGFIVFETFKPEMMYPLLVLRENIYTDPQKPIQVTPGLYDIRNPSPEAPVLVTTNFSITYFSVANEIESSGIPAWLLVTDAEGMSVLTAWAAGKFDSDSIARDVKKFQVADKVSRKRLVLPGHVAVLSGELEESLPDWEIRVGPREAVDLPAFLKQVLK